MESLEFKICEKDLRLIRRESEITRGNALDILDNLSDPQKGSPSDLGENHDIYLDEDYMS